MVPVRKKPGLGGDDRQGVERCRAGGGEGDPDGLGEGEGSRQVGRIVEHERPVAEVRGRRRDRVGRRVAGDRVGRQPEPARVLEPDAERRHPQSRSVVAEAAEGDLDRALERPARLDPEGGSERSGRAAGDGGDGEDGTGRGAAGGDGELDVAGHIGERATRGPHHRGDRKALGDALRSGDGDDVPSRASARRSLRRSGELAGRGEDCRQREKELDRDPAASHGVLPGAAAGRASSCRTGRPSRPGPWPATRRPFHCPPPGRTGR